MTSSLAFTTIGSGPPIVILHGLFGSGVNWRGIAQTLATHWQVFLLDLPNHGQSPWIEDMSYPSMAALICEWMTSQGIEKSALIGHSMGGKVGMTLALTDSGIVDSIVVVDIAPVNYPHSHSGLVEAMLQIPLDRVQSRKDADRLLQREVADLALRQFLLQNLRAEADGLRWRINLPVIQRQMDTLTGFPALPSRFDGPALFLYGLNSDYVKNEGIEKAKAYFPSAEFQGVAGAGHWLHAEQPEQAVSAIRQFLTSPQ
ncbi:MAG: alpha/beta fold hydrolase [Gammaproteobacteria bacterium]|nr:alpha/beta fold hydrolase [Gammaproteobacteria bacterium]NDG44021.1 alpha/beta fold hydrolase [Gammaproteobacteria bacterium]